MKLSAIVPAFNEERLLAGTLERINSGLGIAYEAGWSSEVIVCDNNSTDRTAELARAADARVVFEPVNQIARARNRGARAAAGDWLLFVDADSSPTSALFREMIAAISSGRCVGGGATLALPGAPLMVRAWAGAWNCLSRAFTAPEAPLSRPRLRHPASPAARHQRAQGGALQPAGARGVPASLRPERRAQPAAPRVVRDLVRRAALTGLTVPVGRRSRP